MPLEPLPWDRKDFVRERKHSNGYDRASEPLGGPAARWRESPSHGSRNDFDRWGFHSDFRRPPGHGKQGGWHQYPGDLSHGYSLARSGDRFFHEDGGSGPSAPYRDARYSRNFRDKRASFNQKDWTEHSWDYIHHHGTPPNGSGKLYDGRGRRSVDGARVFQPNLDVGDPSNRLNTKGQSDESSIDRGVVEHPWGNDHQHDTPPNASGRSYDGEDGRSIDGTHVFQLHVDVSNASNQLKTKDQPDDGSCDVNESAIGQGVVEKDSLTSMDWKPLKWSRSGSLTSRGSGFSLSSSSKSAGELCDVKNELHPKISTPDETSSAGAVGCIASPTSLDDTTSKKKPRLGWGEGLAKYEKKRVEGPDESRARSAGVLCTSNLEPMHSPAWNLSEKSPWTGVSFESRSPMTPSSVTYSSSPGLDDKSYVKAADIDGDVNHLSPTSATRTLNPLEGLSLSLESMGLKSLVNLDGLLNEPQQNGGQGLMGSGLVKTSALNQLLVLKGDFLKALELTESEVDSLENELRSFKSHSRSDSPCQESSSSMHTDCQRKLCSELDTTIKDMVPCGVMEEGHAEVKDECIDSPGTATSEFMERQGNPPLPDQVRHDHSRDTVLVGSAKYDACTSVRVLDAARSASISNEGLVEKDGIAPCYGDVAICKNLEDNVLINILASNKEIAMQASKLFSNLDAPSGCTESVGAVNSGCNQNGSLVKQKFLKKRKSQRFRERVLSLKHRVFQYLWEEDLRLLSERKYRAKSQKKAESSFRSLHNGFQKYRSTIRSRIASPEHNLSSLPSSRAVSFTSKLLSNPQIRCYRNGLKMPALILDKNEKELSRFLSNNGFVQDPCALERERALINPWTAEETEIFLDKYATFGKDFTKISSFLDHKTTADCVEFYYKNHKSACFKKTKQQQLNKKEKVAPSTRYLMTSGKKWSREMNAVSLDMLGAASAAFAHDYEDMKSEKTSSSSSERKLRRGDGIRVVSTSYNAEEERETEAADVLAGICGSLSSEAMSSCITSSADPGEGTQGRKSLKPDSSRRHPMAAQTVQNGEDTCSDESCGYMDSLDWTDGEKSSFLQALKFHGKDFVMISRCVRTKSKDQCKVFFSKAKKCLGLQMLYPVPVCGDLPAADERDAGRSDTEEACVVENDSTTCGDKLSNKSDESMVMPASDVNYTHDDGPMILSVDPSSGCIPVKSIENDRTGRSQNSIPLDYKAEDAMEVLPDDGSVLNEEAGNGVGLEHRENGVASSCGEEPMSGDDTPMVTAVMDVAKTFSPFSDENHKVAEAEISSDEPGSASVYDLQHCLPDQASPGRGASCSADKGPLGFSMQVETDASACHPRPSTDPCVSTTVARVQPLQVYLKKCQRSTPAVKSTSVLLLHSKCHSQVSKLESRHQPSLCTSKKPCEDGGVKLFGQILSKSSPIDKDTSNTQPEMVSVDTEIDGCAPINNGPLGPDNSPPGSHGLWDDVNRTKGYTLPPSTHLLAKYPRGFASPPRLTTIPEQQQPIEMKQQDEPSEVLRNGLEAVSGLRQIRLNAVEDDASAGGPWRRRGHGGDLGR